MFGREYVLLCSCASGDAACFLGPVSSLSTAGRWESTLACHVVQVLVQAGAYVKDDAIRALTIVVMNASQLHGYAVRAMYTAISNNLAGAEPPLLMAASWCIGERCLGLTQLPVLQPTAFGSRAAGLRNIFPGSLILLYPAPWGFSF